LFFGKFCAGANVGIEHPVFVRNQSVYAILPDRHEALSISFGVRGQLRNILLHTSPILTIIGENFVHVKPLTNISGLLVVTTPQREGDGCQNHQPNNTKVHAHG
jgi:hypothetical protein